MKHKRFIFLFTALFALSGCKAVSETFDRNDFHSTDFSANYYTHIPTRYKNNEYDIKQPRIAEFYNDFGTFSNIYETIIKSDINAGMLSLNDAVRLYGDENAKTLLSEGKEEALIHEALKTSSKATIIEYAKYNNLSTHQSKSEQVSESFRQGVFSKLTDGNVWCGGLGTKSRVQINEEGIGQVFAHELITYRNLIISLRGGTNIDYDELRIPRVSSAKINLHISFYIEKSSTHNATKYTLTIPIEDLEVDNNMFTNNISLNLFSYFIDIGADTEAMYLLKRASGITISFDLVEHAIIKPAGEEKNDEHEFTVMLYEIMLPYSTWN